MKYAELSSAFDNEQDAKKDYKQKYEVANQNLLLKEDIIKKLVKQLEPNPNDDRYRERNNRNNNTISSTGNDNNRYYFDKNNYNTNTTSRPLPLNPLNIEPSDFKKYKIEQNSNIISARLDREKNPKKAVEFFGSDDNENYYEDNYMTTIGINPNLYRKTEESLDKICESEGNNSGYSKTEHMENMKNYKELRKKEKTKSSIFGSIKGFFNK